MTRRTVVLAYIEVQQCQTSGHLVAVAAEFPRVNHHREIEPDGILSRRRTGDVHTRDGSKALSHAGSGATTNGGRSLKSLELFDTNQRANLQHLAVEAGQCAMSVRNLAEIANRLRALDQIGVVGAEAATLHRVEGLRRVEREDLGVAEAADGFAANRRAKRGRAVVEQLEAMAPSDHGQRIVITGDTVGVN